MKKRSEDSVNSVSNARFPQFNLPPSARSRAALGMTAAAALGVFKLQICGGCDAVQYPPREVCCHCLSDALEWREQKGEGELVSETTLRHSNNIFFQERLPWRVGIVHLDSGPTLMVHLHGDVGQAPQRVKVGVLLDKSGQAALVAYPNIRSATDEGDEMVQEMTSHPEGRNVLVVEGETPLGQALVRDLIKAGAKKVWVGHAAAIETVGIPDHWGSLASVELIPLDVTDDGSVSNAAAQIGGQLDIVVNNTEFHLGQGAVLDQSIDVAMKELSVNYMGLLRLAKAFSPDMKKRAAATSDFTLAWVNVLSIYALSNYPSHGTYSASKAAAYSLSQGLRANMQTAGVRVVNVFPGPLDDGSGLDIVSPKVAPSTLAKVIIQGLQRGVEDIYPDNVAREWLALWLENPKVLERELAVGS